MPALTVIEDLTLATQGGGLATSSGSRSTMQVCYRVLPSTSSDVRLRPDLRLAHMDAAVRQVANVVRWVQAMAGVS